MALCRLAALTLLIPVRGAADLYPDASADRSAELLQYPRVDETLIADIIRSGASVEELAQAWAWVNADEALINDGRPLPSGRIAELVTLLDPQEQDEHGDTHAPRDTDK